MLFFDVELEVQVKHVPVLEHLEPEPALHTRGAGDRDPAGEHGEGLRHPACPKGHDRVSLHPDLLDQVLALPGLTELGKPYDLGAIIAFASVIITGTP